MGCETDRKNIPEMTFDHIVGEIKIKKYLKRTTCKAGRIGYDPGNILKTTFYPPVLGKSQK